MAAVAGTKRFARTASAEALVGPPPGKRQEVCHALEEAAAHLLPPAPLESKAAFFRRLGARLRRGPFSAAHSFERDGLYVYKRPVRSGTGDKAALLAGGGSVFHHVVVYVKAGEELTALEFNPANGMDITDNMMLDTPAAPVLHRPAPPPEPACLPMLHIDAPHHPLEAAHVQQALAFAEAQPYHALKSNCIAFADYAVRVLTGGAVRSAPLIFDLVVGQVPPVDSPLLALLALTTQLSWHDVVHGGRLLAGLLAAHPDALRPPPGSGEPLQLLLPEEAAPAAPPAGPAAQAAPALPADLPAPLAALLASSGLLQPAQQLPLQQQPAGSSSGSDDTCATEAAAPSGSAAARVPSGSALASTGVSSGSALASTGTSKPPLGGAKGLGLPPRGAKPAARR